MTQTQERLIALISPLLEPLGYEIVHLEVQNQRQKVLRLFVDSSKGVGIEDCVKVTKALDEPLDAMPEIEAVFKGHYELEVSSPGADRPLRRSKDYEKFSGKEARIHVFRPLTAEELENTGYHQKNPRQKNFLGTLKGVRGEKVLLALENKLGEVTIPLPLISKANLEPRFDLAAIEKERERK